MYAVRRSLRCFVFDVFDAFDVFEVLEVLEVPGMFACARQCLGALEPRSPGALEPCQRSPWRAPLPGASRRSPRAHTAHPGKSKAPKAIRLQGS